MSRSDLARRSTAEFVFDGVNITASVQPYLLSVTYTDNEEDETDDLQIRLQDRDDVWLEKWLNDAIESAVSSDAPSLTTGEVSDSGVTYTVEPGDTLSGIAGKYLAGSSKYMEIFELNADILSDPNKIYPGQVLKIPAESNGEVTVSGVKNRLQIQATFTRKNWGGDGKNASLDCGKFELDSIDATGPPAVIVIKATSLPYSVQFRQTKKSKAWEAYTLSGIANEMAAANGMICMYESANDPSYERVEQYKESDITFLSSLCHDAGISLKVTNHIIVLFDQATYEAKDAVATIKKGSGKYIKYKLSTGTADAEYASCRVSYTDPGSGKSIEGVAKVEDYKADAKNNQQLEITAKVADAAEAKTLAEKMLRLHNKFAKTASFTLPGDPSLVAGVTVMLEKWGAWSGKYIVKQAKHTIDSSGYTVQVKLRKVLEGY